MSGIIGSAGSKSGRIGAMHGDVPHFSASWNYNANFWNDQYMSSSGSLTGWTARQDPGGNFDTTEGIYSAPVNGTYAFHWHDNVISNGTGHWQFHWYKNNNNTSLHIIYGFTAGSAEWQCASGSAMFRLNAGDGIRLRMYGPGSGIKPDGGAYSCFQGHLVG